MEVLEIIVFLLFHLKKSFLYQRCIILMALKKINLDDITNEKNEDHNRKWPHIPDHQEKQMYYLI